MSRMIQMSEAPIDFELIRQEFIAKYRKLLDDRGLDAVFVTRIENVASLTRFRAPFGRFHYVMRYAVILSREHLTFLVRDGDYDRASRRMPWLTDVRETSNFLGDAVDVLARAFADHGVSKGAIGVDLLPLNSYRKLSAALPEISFEDIDDDIVAFRAVKSAEEIKVLQAGIEVIEKGMAVGMEYVKPGMRECEVCAEIGKVLTQQDVEGHSLPPIVLGSDHLGTLHRHYSDAQLREGDFCRMDITAVWNNYVVDFGRTTIVGKPNEFQRRVANAAYESQVECIKAIRPGVQASEIDRIAREVISDAGFGEYMHRHFTGHGVGLSHQELPMLGEPLVPENDMPLEAGMVIAIEPGIKFHDQPRLGGVWFEDMVLVTETGHEYMTRSAYSEELLGFYAAPPGPWREHAGLVAEAA